MEEQIAQKKPFCLITREKQVILRRYTDINTYPAGLPEPEKVSC